MRGHWSSYLGYHFISWLFKEDVCIHVILNFTSSNIGEQYQLLPVIKAVAEILLDE